MKLVLPVFIILFSNHILFCQDIFIYHGNTNETKIYDANKKQVDKCTIKKSKGETVAVQILNPNPFFYTYELRYEEQKEVSEDKAIIDALSALGLRLSDTLGGLKEKEKIDDYFNKIDKLIKEIDSVKSIIESSDGAEMSDEALVYSRNGGLRKAIEQINNLPNSTLHFNSTTLLKDLEKLSESFNGSKDLKQFINVSLVSKVKELKENLRKAKSVISQKFVTTEKSAKIFLSIKPIDPSNKNLRRDIYDKEIEIATVSLLYERSTLELVPVGSFIFSQNVSEFYLQNNIVAERKIDKSKFSTGLILNVNMAKFGDYKEMSFGVGLGYKLSNDSDLNSLFFSSLFSYKSFLRIGLGLGASQFPSGLKEGSSVGQTLPSNISNISEIVVSENRFSGFLTFSFTGLNLTKK